MIELCAGLSRKGDARMAGAPDASLVIARHDRLALDLPWTSTHVVLGATSTTSAP